MPRGSVKSAKEIEYLKIVAEYVAANAVSRKGDDALPDQAEGIAAVLEWIQGDEVALEGILGDLSYIYEEKEEPNTT